MGRCMKSLIQSTLIQPLFCWLERFTCPLSWLNFLLTTGSFYSEALAQKNLNFLLYHLLALDLISAPLPA